MHTGLSAYEARRADYPGVRRPDVLMHGHHGLSDQDALILHNTSNLPSLEDGQVRNPIHY